MHKTLLTAPWLAPEWMHEAIHDLCQPLTALECLLFLMTLDLDKTFPDSKVTIGTALELCTKMRKLVRIIQDRLAESGIETGASHDCK